MNGRIITQQRVGNGPAIVELDLSEQPAGVYAAELSLDAVRTGTVKLTVQ